ncbi:MAG: DUF2798 domain-containing protein [Rhodobacteraceae bacterium]|nr:DUF2798 domain-containing protein [Paracoccaceae bacterium]
MLPAKLSPILFSLILSGIMSLVEAGLTTFRSLGWETGFTIAWMKDWGLGWPVAFTLVIMLSPLVRRIVSWLVKADS